MADVSLVSRVRTRRKIAKNMARAKYFKFNFSPVDPQQVLFSCEHRVDFLYFEMLSSLSR